MTTYDTSMNEAAMCGASNILHALHTYTSNEEKTIKIEMSNVFLCVYTFQIAGIAYTHFMYIELKHEPTIMRSALILDIFHWGTGISRFKLSI